MAGFAIPLAIGLSTVGSIAGGILQANAAKKAAEENARVQREALAVQKLQREQARQDQLAQIEIGQAATRTLAGLGDTSGDFTTQGAEGAGLDRTFEDERADFLVSEGERSINRALAARGQSFSGAALEAIGRNTTDIRTASTQREVDLLSNLANLGTTAAQGVGVTTANLTGQSSQSLANIGQQNAQGILDRGQAFASIGTGIGQAATTGIILEQNRQALENTKAFLEKS
jgi:hypothetical protein